MTDPEQLDAMRRGRMEAREWPAALERLRLMHPTDEVLAAKLDVSAQFIRNLANGSDTPSGETRERIVDLLNEVRQERLRALEALTTMIQALHWVEDEVLTEEQLHVAEDRLKRVKNRLYELTDTLTDETPST